MNKWYENNGYKYIVSIQQKTIIYNAALIWCEVVIYSLKMFQFLFSVREKPEKPNFPGKIELKWSNNAMLLPH